MSDTSASGTIEGTTPDGVTLTLMGTTNGFWEPVPVGGWITDVAGYVFVVTGAAWRNDIDDRMCIVGHWADDVTEGRPTENYAMCSQGFNVRWEPKVVLETGVIPREAAYKIAREIVDARIAIAARGDLAMIDDKLMGGIELAEAVASGYVQTLTELGEKRLIAVRNRIMALRSSKAARVQTAAEEEAEYASIDAARPVNPIY